MPIDTIQVTTRQFNISPAIKYNIHMENYRNMNHIENTAPPLFVSEEELERLFGLSRSYWQKNRVRGGGIPFYKIGRSVRYRLSEVEAFFESNRAHSTSHTDQLNNERRQ